MVERDGKGSCGETINQVKTAQRKVAPAGNLEQGAESDFGIDVKTEQADGDKQNACFAIAAAPVNGQHDRQDDGKQNGEGKIAEKLDRSGRDEEDSLQAAEGVHDSGKDEKNAPAPAETVVNERQEDTSDDIRSEHTQQRCESLPEDGNVYEAGDDRLRQFQQR